MSLSIGLRFVRGLFCLAYPVRCFGFDGGEGDDFGALLAVEVCPLRQVFVGIRLLEGGVSDSMNQGVVSA